MAGAALTLGWVLLPVSAAAADGIGCDVPDVLAVALAWAGGVWVAGCLDAAASASSCVAFLLSAAAACASWAAFNLVGCTLSRSACCCADCVVCGSAAADAFGSASVSSCGSGCRDGCVSHQGLWRTAYGGLSSSCCFPRPTPPRSLYDSVGWLLLAAAFARLLHHAL